MAASAGSSRLVSTVTAKIFSAPLAAFGCGAEDLRIAVDGQHADAAARGGLHPAADRLADVVHLVVEEDFVADGQQLVDQGVHVRLAGTASSRS